MKSGMFCFIKDEFIKKYKQKYGLMDNKENGNKRPAYFVFKDKYYHDIFWFVPLSSQYDKYYRIYSKLKIATLKKYNKNLEPYNFVFWNEKSVFLIQNMFPVTEKYIINDYKKLNYHISNKKKKEIIDKVSNVLYLTKKGKVVTFTNLPSFLVDIKYELLNDKRELYSIITVSEDNLFINNHIGTKEEQLNALSFYTFA